MRHPAKNLNKLIHSLFTLLALASSIDAAEWREVQLCKYRDTDKRWYHFGPARVVQILGPREMLVSQERFDEIPIIYVTNYPTADLVDGKKIWFNAMQTGRYEYITTLGANARIVKFDFGSDIPASEELVWEQRYATTEGWAETWIANQRTKATTAHQKLIDDQTARRAAESKAMVGKVLVLQMQQASNGLPSFQYDLGMRYLAGNGVESNRAVAPTGWKNPRNKAIRTQKSNWTN